MSKKNSNKKDEAKNDTVSRRGFLAGSLGLASGIVAGSYGVSEFLPPQKVEEVIIGGEITEKYVCPYTGSGFDSFEELKQNIVEEGLGNRVRMPTIKEVDEPHYEEMIVEDLERFEQKNIAFARSQWDEDYRDRLLEFSELEEKPPKEAGWGGFTTPEATLESMEGFAQRSGAIYVDEKVGNTNYPQYTGFSGFLRSGQGLWEWEDEINDEKLEIDNKEGMSKKVKDAAKMYGADMVGITKLDSRWVYSKYFDRETNEEGNLSLEGGPAPESETNISYDYAIAIAVKHNWEGIRESPGWGASAAVAGGYSAMAEVASKLAKYIRGLGYPAVPSGNDTTLSVPISIDAGLGEAGRHGLLMTPKYGPNVRLAQVLTDLPLEEDNPIEFGIQEFCSRCKQCARKCPVDAIPFEEKSEETPGGISNLEGMERWTVDTPLCLGFWVENNLDCANCIEACPWTRPRFKRDMYGAEV